ncbi:hypothetical protein J6590_082917 [Homalodisca vitripennis]|nr:hypothetical protein J6590_082917 [Homalodisca vitripennis]
MSGPGHDTSGERRASSGTRASPERRGWSRYKRRDEDLVHLLLLSENSILKRRVVRGCQRGIKRWGVHPINRRRRVYGEYHHLIKQLKEDPERCCLYHSTMMNDTEIHIPNFQFDLAGGSRGFCPSAILNYTENRGKKHDSSERFGGAFDAKRHRSLSLTAQVYRDTPSHLHGNIWGPIAKRWQSGAALTLDARIVPGALYVRCSIHANLHTSLNKSGRYTFIRSKPIVTSGLMHPDGSSHIFNPAAVLLTIAVGRQACFELKSEAGWCLSEYCVHGIRFRFYLVGFKNRK